MYLDSTEIRELNSWIQAHVKENHPANYFEGTLTKHIDLLMEGVGVRIEERSGGGIGTRIIGICALCKQENDVTNYNHW